MLIHPCEYKMRHFLSVAMGISFLVVSFLLIYHYRLTTSIVWSRPSSGGNDDKSIVIAVLGGGLTSSGSVPLHTKLRLDKAIDLYHQLKSTHHQVIIIPLSAGTPYKPNPVDVKVEIIAWYSLSPSYHHYPHHDHHHPHTLFDRAFQYLSHLQLRVTWSAREFLPRMF